MERPYLNKGNVSSLISFGLLVAGLLGRRAGVAGSSWVLAAGLFGFAGGITNWLAVKMLFDPVPLLYGSGVIPARFREIRVQIRDLIMRHFFATEYLERFLAARDPAPHMDMAQRIQEMLDSEEVDQAIDRKLAEMTRSPLGIVLQIAGTQRTKPLVYEFAGEIGKALAPQLERDLRAQAVDPAALRDQVDKLLAAKLQELNPERVKRMMEEVIRHHLGWLIVWGNVFGGAVGILALALGYAS